MAHSSPSNARWTIAERPISNNGGDVNALYVAADAYSGLGDLGFKKAHQPGQTASLRKANWTEAQSWYAKSLAAQHRIEHPNRSAMNGFDVGDPTQVTKNCINAKPLWQGSASRLSKRLPA